MEIAEFWHHGRRVEPNRGSGVLQTGLENVIFCFSALLSSTKQIKKMQLFKIHDLDDGYPSHLNI